MPDTPFTVYQLRKFMRKNANNDRKEERLFGRLINDTLTHNGIKYTYKRHLKVTIPGFGYQPEIDLAYFISDKKICVEVDGAYHNIRRQEFIDQYRDAKLKEVGWLVHRIKEWRYEDIFSSEPLRYDILRKSYFRLFDDLQGLFRWSRPIPDSKFLGFLELN